MRRTEHALAIILLGGFFLVEPPFGDTVNTKAPLSQWTQVSSHDSSAACEQARLDHVANAESGLGTVAEADQADSKLTAARDARQAARCVPDAELFGANATE